MKSSYFNNWKSQKISCLLTYCEILSSDTFLFVDILFLFPLNVHSGHIVYCVPDIDCYLYVNSHHQFKVVNALIHHGISISLLKNIQQILRNNGLNNRCMMVVGLKRLRENIHICVKQVNWLSNFI